MLIPSTLFPSSTSHKHLTCIKGLLYDINLSQLEKFAIFKQTEKTKGFLQAAQIIHCYNRIIIYSVIQEETVVL